MEGLKEKKAISYDQAKKEITGWLDQKKVSQKKRESLSSMVENLIEAVQEGKLIVEENGTLTQILDYPNENLTNSNLTYKQRISSVDIEPHRRTVKGDSIEDTILRILLALTGAPINVIRGLDLSTDRAVADSIAVFFM